MDKNRIEGAQHEVKGAIKEAVGKVTNNSSKQLAGNLEKNVGKVQTQAVQAPDEARALDKKSR